MILRIVGLEKKYQVVEITQDELDDLYRMRKGGIGED